MSNARAIDTILTEVIQKLKVFILLPILSSALKDVVSRVFSLAFSHRWACCRSTMTRSLLSCLVLSLATILSAVSAQTVYYPKNPQVIFNNDATPSSSATGAAYTGPPAYNPTTLNRPGLPNPVPPLQFPVTLTSGGMPNLSIPQPGNFMGFSIEMSVATQIRERLPISFVATHPFSHVSPPLSVGRNRYVDANR